MATATPNDQKTSSRDIEIETRPARAAAAASVPPVARQPCSAAATARGVACRPSTATCVSVAVPAW